MVNRTYCHGSYHQFRINDPKPRDISKASVRDRLLHHAVYRVLYPFFARRFIADSFSCQLGKGTHRALDRFRAFAYRASRNHTRSCWVLKCDIRKFFASIGHGILSEVLARHISDPDTRWLLARIIGSFSPGLPLGNLTSQLFVNIYMNEFDQFVKHRLKVKYYVRYADDFVFLHHDRDYLAELLPRVGDFLKEALNLDLHPNKVSITTLASGIDFLGWVHFLDHRVLRTTTKRRMLRRLAQSPTEQTVQSYRGLLGHGNTEQLRRRMW
ncbi:MAG TPA: reverse transcriptase/maturase family protein [Candidatus Paceibacterota bacterium]|nr:reverse transcriptase/maturase family protein [Candidatus Paceibacterota bacterium]